MTRSINLAVLEDKHLKSDGSRTVCVTEFLYS